MRIRKVVTYEVWEKGSDRPEAVFNTLAKAKDYIKQAKKDGEAL